MKEAKWTLGNGKEIDFYDIKKKASTIKKITLSLGSNKFIADASKGELIVNGQINRFTSGIDNPTNEKIKYQISCYKRRVREISTVNVAEKTLPYTVAFLIGLKIFAGDVEHERYIIATDADKNKHEFQIISERKKKVNA